MSFPIGPGLSGRLARWLGAVAADRLTLFSFIWAVTSLVHVVSFYHSWIRLFGSAVYIYPIAVSALAVLIRPRNTGLFMVLLLCTIL